MIFLRAGVYSIVALLFYCVQPGSTLFSWHPTLMVVGSMLFMYEGVLLLQPKTSLLAGKSREVKRNVHGVLQMIGAGLMLTGFACVVIHKNNINKPHLTSLHSIIGFTSGTLTFFQVVGGAVTRFQRLAPIDHNFMKLGHTIFGLLTYLAIGASIIAGILFTEYASTVAPPAFQMVLMWLPMVAFGTGFSNIISKLCRILLKPRS